MIKKLLASLLTMCIILSPFVAGTALAADGDIEIDLTTIAEDPPGTGYSFSEATGLLTLTSAGPFLVTTSGDGISGRGIVVAPDPLGTIVEITLSNASIANTADGACAFALAPGASAEVTFAGSNVLTSGKYRAGLEVTAGSEVTITGTAGARLTASGGVDGAGIGGGHEQGSGRITICGNGTVEARGGNYGAGIGGGFEGPAETNDGTDIEITGGIVIATPGHMAAAIGGGGATLGSPHDSNRGGDVLISEASVTAAGPIGNGAMSDAPGTLTVGKDSQGDCDPWTARASLSVSDAGVPRFVGLEGSLAIGTCTLSGNGAYNVDYDHPVAGEYYRGNPAKVNPVDDQTLADLTEGYGPNDRQIATISVTNISAQALDDLGVALSGETADCFVLTPPPLTDLPSDPGSNTTSFTVVAVEGLSHRTYTATATISATDMADVTFTVTQVVKAKPVEEPEDEEDDEPPQPVPIKTEKSGDMDVNSTEVPSETASGKSSTTVPERVMDALLDKAVSTGGTAEEDVIEVFVKTPGEVGDVDEVSATVRRNDLEQIVDQTDASFRVSSSIGSVTFDHEALQAVVGAGSGRNIKITTARVPDSRMSAAQRAAVNGRPVYDLTVMNGNIRVSDFGGGFVTVKIPYTLQPGENPNAIVVYLLADDGNLVLMEGRYVAEEGAVVFTTSHFSLFVIGYNPVSFVDVLPGAQHKDAVDFLAARGITTGTGNGEFSPDASLLRGECLVLVMRAYGIGPERAGEFGHVERFDDAGDAYYADYLLVARELGIVDGTGNNLFEPERPVTRQESLTIIRNTLAVAQASESLDPLTEGDFLAGSDITGGDAADSPASTVTRGEMAGLLYVLLSD